VKSTNTFPPERVEVFMSRIEWNDEYSVGNDVLDEQHRKLFDMINALGAAMVGDAADILVEGILIEMTDYIDIHFSTEERYMQQADYPEFKEHRSQHAIYVKKSLGFLKGYREGSERLTDEILHFLKDWLIEHILGKDKQYAPYLSEKVLT
jgi:hemerythrin-like metal-binding protein